VGLDQLVRILVVKITHLILNFKFIMCVVFMINYFLVRCDVSIDSETLLMIDFINFKIKPTQSFRCADRGKIYVCVLIGVSANTYINIYVYTIFKKQ
jgi:hypothetical protein